MLPACVLLASVLLLCSLCTRCYRGDCHGDPFVVILSPSLGPLPPPLQYWSLPSINPPNSLLLIPTQQKATECVGVVAVTMGKERFHPYFERFWPAAMQVQPDPSVWWGKGEGTVPFQESTGLVLLAWIAMWLIAFCIYTSAGFWFTDSQIYTVPLFCLFDTKRRCGAHVMLRLL